MGILNLVPPPDPWCPGSVFGCIPPIYWTVGVGTIWQCDYCGRVWERVSQPGAAGVRVQQDE